MGTGTDGRECQPTGQARAFSRESLFYVRGA